MDIFAFSLNIKMLSKFGSDGYSGTLSKETVFVNDPHYLFTKGNNVGMRYLIVMLHSIALGTQINSTSESEKCNNNH